MKRVTTGNRSTTGSAFMSNFAASPASTADHQLSNFGRDKGFAVGARLAGLSLQAGLISLCLLCLPVATTAAAAVTPETLGSLEKQFQQFSDDFYTQIITQSRLSLEKAKTVAELKDKVDAYLRSGKTVPALALIHFNLPTIRNNIDAIEVVPLVAVLLQHNDWHTAKRIFDLAKSEAGKPANSNLSFVFAKYFMQRKDWPKAQQHLENIVNELSTEDANYARLMIGTLLQQQKKHRAAVIYYKDISKTSRYYPSAVLNTAVAYIRQDWWTDAQIIIDDLIKNHKEQVSDEMVDRLNLVLGYALLRKEYFRNSRETFRNVRFDSPYTNKALLGIALTAANQEDYVGSLNAITLLKEKKSTDLAVDEAYLLLPYTYGKLKQYLTASSAYTDAIKYYQGRIDELQAISQANARLPAMISISNTGHEISIKNNNFDYSRHYPQSFFNNYTTLSAFQTYVTDMQNLSIKYHKLLAEHQQTLANISLDLLGERIEYLQSYLNQSRYGLARLFDSSLISANQP